MPEMPNRTRPAIPSDIKKEVRRRCGYGCIFCGCPIYQIDHIIDWSVVREHEVENLTLLCATHHQQKTGGMIAHDTLVLQNSRPYALTHPTSLAATWYFGEGMPIFEIANNFFYYGPSDLFYAPVVINSISPLRFYMEDGHMLLDFVAHDNNGSEIIKIERNEMLLLPGSNEIEIQGSNVIIREASHRILLDLTIMTDINKVILKRAKISVSDNRLTISPNKFRLDNGHIQNLGLIGCQFYSMSAVAINSPGVSAAIVS